MCCKALPVAVFGLLDHLGCSRADLYEQLMNHLRDALVERVVTANTLQGKE